MKYLKQLLFILPLLLGIILFTSCGDDDPEPGADQTIAEIANDNENLTSLTAALNAADLFSTLDGTAQYTVFAPTDAAFSAFLSANNFDNLEDVPTELLRSVLLNHVVSGEKKAADLTTGYEKTLSASGPGNTALSLFVNTDGGVTLNGNATVSTADVDASNGVVHIVNNVIATPSVVTHAVANPTFNSLVAALSRTDLSTNLVDALSGAGPFTVFAPTDEAFTLLYQMLGVNGLSDIDAETLEQVLTYHVISGANVLAGDLSAGAGPSTLQGEAFEFSLDNGAQIIDASGTATDIIATDVQGSNGVVHAVNRVLLPSTAIEEMEPSIVDIAVSDGRFTSLVDALTKTDLVNTLNTAGPFTIFAPTDDAFSAFLSSAGFGSLDDVPTDILRQVLLNHVVAGNNTSSTLTSDYFTTLADGPLAGTYLPIYVDTESGVTVNGISNVTQADVLTRNGVIHVVDAVIGLPDVVTHAVANPTFNILEAALTRGDLSTDLVAALQGEGPFTVFAPTDMAFMNLLSDLGLSSLSDIPAATLEEVLKYHVIAGDLIFAADLSNGAAPATLEGTAFDISLDNGAQIIDASGTATNVIATDVLATNGIIHGIDRVLLPESVYDAVNPSIVNIAASNPDFSILVDAVIRAGLVETLDLEGDFTVFAPTNAAFMSFLQDKGFSSLDDVPVPVLTEILLNHVVSGKVLSMDLEMGYNNTLASSPENDGNLSLYVDISSGVILNGNTAVVQPNIEARNGVIHAVSSVIDIPTIVTFAGSNSEFSILVEALTRTGLMTDFLAVLQSEGPFTVFAPNNAAFAALLMELGAGSLNDVPTETLEQVLLYHVIGDFNIRSTEITDDVSVQTLQGGNFSISTDSGVIITDNRNRESEVLFTDIQAGNGVIHVINAVLLP